MIGNGSFVRILTTRNWRTARCSSMTNWPRIQPLLEAEAARAVAAGHTLYHHPTIKQALRTVVGALPPLENGGIARSPPSDLAFLDDIAAHTWGAERWISHSRLRSVRSKTWIRWSPMPKGRQTSTLRTI